MGVKTNLKAKARIAVIKSKKEREREFQICVAEKLFAGQNTV